MRRYVQKIIGGKRTKPEWFLLILVTLQIIAIFVFNFTRMKYSMDYDAICAVTQAAEMWKQKTLFLADWSYQTTLGLDSGVPLVALVYGVTKNLFFSYGVVNCLFVQCVNVGLCIDMLCISDTFVSIYSNYERGYAF